MNLYAQHSLMNNPNSIRFLRENSYFYKYINRDSKYLVYLEREMKVKYKLTVKDRIDRFTEGIDKVSQIMDIFS